MLILDAWLRRHTNSLVDVPIVPEALEACANALVDAARALNGVAGAVQAPA
jgi:hypothetical protein